MGWGVSFAWGVVMSSPSDHLTDQDLVAFTAGDLEPASSASVHAHLLTCGSCADRQHQLLAFSSELDAAWNRERLRNLNAVHPSSSQIEALWFREGHAEDREITQRHISQCPACAEHLERLKQGMAILSQEDPLNAGEQWGEKITRRFSAGLEVIVDAAHGAFTSATGMIQDVMVPQARSSLGPGYAVAMGVGETPGQADTIWHDAVFQTDDLSGELTGSMDHKTGRGVVTVMINKQGYFMGAPPLVDLVDATGAIVKSQYALDAGDRYTAQFRNLQEGRYLVGVHEPGE